MSARRFFFFWMVVLGGLRGVCRRGGKMKGMNDTLKGKKAELLKKKKETRNESKHTHTHTQNEDKKRKRGGRKKNKQRGRRILALHTAFSSKKTLPLSAFVFHPCLPVASAIAFSFFFFL
eukprot:TRINITY_DN2202_c2_g1_i3.p5 TRINITY_DN2202_c2_g1~~TRINITY_DN2202_c2_g1_i3.p5  ORF type:complete len:120 (+),score=12.45 TRINITY_DN2202_c2_g1_i3:403-762(+)